MSQTALPLETVTADAPKPATSWAVPKVADRFPLYIAEEITVDELRRALNSAGMHLHGDIEGRWVIDRVHALALVLKDEPATPAT